MHDILCFHRTHGSAITLSDDKSVASRTSDYANAIIFSAQPIKVGQKVCVELTQSTEWMGAIRVGLTSHDPAKIPPTSLPRYVSPDLTRKDGYWAKGLDESYAKTGCRLTLTLTRVGQVVYHVNKHHCGVLLTRLPTSGQLWLVFDVYGNTTAVKFVCAEELPVEIVARGPDAVQAYHTACESGTQAMFRTRLMFVGQQGVGKTTLKNALLGQRHQEVEESPGTIDLSASCSFSLRDRTSWKLAVKGERSLVFSEEQDPLDTSGGVTNIEDDYHNAVAANLILELLYQNMRHRGHEEERGSMVGKTGTVRRSSGRQRRSSTGRDKRTRDAAANEDHMVLSGSVRSHLPQDTPERVVRLVEEMMRQRELGVSQSVPPGGKDKKTLSQPSHDVQLNIWDFAGRSLYYITHQMFLTARAVYVIVFDLTADLDTMRPASQEAGEKGISSGLDYIDYWLHTIHVHTARNTHSGAANTSLSPPVFVIGTHRHALHHDSNVCQQMVKAKFERIQQMIKNKPYKRHIVSHYYAVECGLEEDDPEVGNLRRHLEDIASQEPYMGEQIPLRWLRFESAIAELVENDTDFVTLNQLQTVAMSEGITEEVEFHTLLQFYHDLGVIVYYGSTEHCDPILRSTVILRPEWLVVMFTYVLFAQPDPSKQCDEDRVLWQRLELTGAMEERLVELVWQDVTLQKAALLSLMEKFDLICEQIPPKHATPRTGAKQGRSFYVPSRLINQPTSVKLFTPTEADIVFYLDFNGFLPDGLFQRLLTRVIRWSLERGGHEPLLTYHQARCFLDSEHDLALQVAPLHMARIKVTILRAACLDSSDDTSSESSLEKQLPSPKPAAAAKVRHFLEVTLTDLRNKWIQHLSYTTCVQCYCEWPCETHNAPQCSHDQCQHFLNLDECIANKIVCCEHRRVKTLRYRKWFPAPVPLFKKGPILDAAVLKGVEATQGNIESRHGPDLPGWVKSIAKLLNGGSEGQDWTALAYNLGYTKAKLEKFNEDLNPSLAMVTDWIISSGNTPLSVDMIISSLELMQRDDIVAVIQRGRESEVEPVQVFISYQWDIQDEVRALRNKLETAGFTCWMDVGQMGGGDQLYGKIDAAIRGCQVAIACITPKYIVSQLCMKEVGLADLLRKPIIPIMYSKVPWPPLGGMALTFSQLVYININGVGGHGGSGIHADLADKYQEIIQRVSCYAATLPSDISDPSPQAFHDSKQSMRSASLHSVSSQPEAILVEGYASDYSAPSNRVTLPSLQRTAPSSGHSHEVAVEQVHITKCTVCAIL